MVQWLILIAAAAAAIDLQEVPGPPDMAAAAATGGGGGGGVVVHGDPAAAAGRRAGGGGAVGVPYMPHVRLVGELGEVRRRASLTRKSSLQRAEELLPCVEKTAKGLPPRLTREGMPVARLR
jgi:hypothetical protein